MKMKKSKVIIPALAVLVLSTAASVTGTVAWFTATRERTVTAGEFTVKATGENLNVDVADGIGTTANNTTKDIALGDSLLTDASFNHTNVSNYIINPTGNKKKVQSAVGLAAAILSPNTTVLRDANTYSTVTWDMTFSVSFGAVAGKDLGLFLDVSHAETYIHEKVHLAKNAVIPASTYYATGACTGDYVAAGTVSAEGGVDYYKPAPDQSGKGFRIAFVPQGITVTGTGAGSDTHGTVAFGKVWAPHRAWNSNANSSEVKFVNQTAANADLTEDNYTNNTTKYYYNSSYQAAAATAGTDADHQKVVIDSSVTSALPNDNTLSPETALSGSANYLGMFDSVANTTVSIKFTCVAWYDGTDADVQNDRDLETVVASMHFAIVDLITAA